MNTSKVIFRKDVTEEIENIASILEYDWKFKHSRSSTWADANFDDWLDQCTDSPLLRTYRDLIELDAICCETNPDWHHIFRLDYSTDTDSYEEIIYKDTVYQLETNELITAV